MDNLQTLQQSLCGALCQDISLYRSEGHIVVPLPLTARDGDGINVYLDGIPGGWKVSDLGTTMMRLSYDFDLEKLRQGTRGRLLKSIVAECGVKESEGEIFTEVPADRLLSGIFAVGQAAARAGDLSLWTRARTESTFLEDLKETLQRVAPNALLRSEYLVPGIPDRENYVIDFMMEAPARPLYIMGISSTARARLATITLQHLLSHNHDFESMAVFANIDEIPKPDLRRLMNAANDMVPSLEDIAALKRKLEHRLRVA